jgi:hypothetical protein
MAWRGAALEAQAACENRRFALHETMDTEQINAVGTLLADLSARTQQLRGYL